MTVEGDRRRCRFYREHIREEPPRDDIEPFWDFSWLETPTKKAHLSALTTLPDCNDLSFTVQLAHTAHTEPTELGSAGFGDEVPDHGPTLATLPGLVRKGVAYALWTPGDYDPFEATSWFRNVPVEAAPREILPPYQPPIFTVLGHGTWGVGGPPGSDIRHLELTGASTAPVVALRHDGKFILVNDPTGLATLEREHRIIAIRQHERRLEDPPDSEEP